MSSSIESRTKLLKFVDKLLKITGPSIFKDTNYTKVMPILELLTLGFILILGCIEPFTGNNLNMMKFAQLFELMGPYTQGIWKILVHKYYMPVIRKLLKDMDDHFWPSHRYRRKLKLEKEKTFHVLYVYCSAQYSGMVICLFIIVLFPLTSSTRTTPFSCYKIFDYEENTAYYIFIYLGQTFNAVLGGMIVTAFDALFLDLVMRILFEIRVLCEEMENMKEFADGKNEKECYEKIKDYVKHHDLLLRMLADVKKIYSIILLNQFLASTITLCIGLYNISAGPERGINILAIRGLAFTGTFLMQLSIYCMAGSMIEYECENLSNYIFASGWQNGCNKRIRNAIVMIIIRSRRTPKLTAANIIYANLGTLGKILQFSISFYTLMSKEKTHQNY